MKVFPRTERVVCILYTYIFVIIALPMKVGLVYRVTRLRSKLLTHCTKTSRTLYMKFMHTIYYKPSQIYMRNSYFSILKFICSYSFKRIDYNHLIYIFNLKHSFCYFVSINFYSTIYYFILIPNFISIFIFISA